MKICNGPLCCGTQCELSNFGKDKSKKDGLNVYCKKCNRHYSEKYRNSEIGAINRKVHRNTKKYKDYMKNYELKENRIDWRSKYFSDKDVIKHRKDHLVDWRKTSLGRATTMWNNAKRRTKKNVKFLLEREQFIAWAVPELDKFLNEFPNGFPSLDRVDSRGHCQLPRR